MLRHQKRLVYIAAALAVCLIMLGTSWAYVGNLNQMLKQENYEYLEEVAKQSADTVNKKLDGDMRMLRAVAVMMGNLDELDVSRWVRAFGEEKLFEQFQRVGVILPDGRGYGQDVTGTDFSDREYFKQAMSGKYYISDVLMDRTTHVFSYTYAVPIYSGGKIVGVLAAVTNMDTYQELLFAKPFMGEGYTYIVKDNGAPVLSSGNRDGTLAFENLFDTIHADMKEKGIMRENMLHGGSGRLEYTTQGEVHFLSYVPLGINRWYVISVLPAQVVQEKSHHIQQLSAVAAAAVCTVFILYLASIVWLQYRSQKKLYQLAYYDELTGLGNKHLIHKQTKELLENERSQYAYCVFDLKRFQLVNDRFGYAQGDALLCHTAGLLRGNLRDGESAARSSADVFHLLLRYENKRELEIRLRELAGQVSCYAFAADPDYRVFVGIGVYIVENQALSSDAMGDMAKLALEQMRNQRTTSCCFYNEALQSKMQEEQEIENEMQRCIDNKEFQVYLQPKYILDTGKIAGAEALVRWQHPIKGLIPPNHFIPLFEKNGFIAELDLYMFEEVCVLLRGWLDSGLTPVQISVNQSRVNLYLPGYLDKLNNILKMYDIPPQYIEIEITESAFIGDMNAMLTVVSHFHGSGFQVSMDDFGSGYSTLNMLQDIMLDEMKIDKNFFSESANSERGMKIVRSVVSMAQDLSIRVVAEGVETAEQVAFLQATGCQLAQGYFYAKPMPWQKFEELAGDVMGAPVGILPL